MYWINKIIWFWTSPAAVCVLTLSVGSWLAVGNNKSSLARRVGKWLVVLAVLALWMMATPIVNRSMHGIVEKCYDRVEACDAPCGDVIVALSGSWRRSWFAAELLKEGKAPLLVVTGIDVLKEDVPLVYDLGVDPAKVLVDNEARNTEENIKFAKRLYENKLGTARKTSPQVLLVTSVYHMPRSVLLMSKYWPEAGVVPMPTEFLIKGCPFSWRFLLPSVDSIVYFNAAFHECVGYLGYKWFRK